MNIKKFNVDKLVWLIPFLFLIHFLAAYPGGMSPDSINQYKQSLSCDFYSSHPPLMAMVWYVLNFVHQGTGLMLALQLGFLWGAVYYLYSADQNNRFRVLYLILPFWPFVFTNTGHILKDIVFGISFLFTFAICYFHSFRDRVNLLAFVACLFIVFYGMAVKFQAQFIVFFVIFYMLHSLLKIKSFLLKVIVGVLITMSMISLNNLIISKFTTDTKWGQYRELFDIAAVAVEIDDDSVFPEYVRESKIYDFERLKSNFSHRWVDPIVFPKDRVYDDTLDQYELEELKGKFYKTISTYPFIYLKHRFLVFKFTALKNSSVKRFATPLPEEFTKTYQIHSFQNNYLKDTLRHALVLVPKFLNYNIISVFLLFGYFGVIVIFKNRWSLQHTHLTVITITTFALALVFAFATMASDYRYYFPIRLWSAMAIPMMLQIIFSNSKRPNAKK